MEFNDLTELEKYLNGLIGTALETSVKPVAEETMQMHIQRDVYAAYTPYSTDGKTPHYERTGKLLQDVEGHLIDNNTLVIEDTRSENGRDIVKVIEEGKNYQWGYKRNLDKEIGERPFVKNTYEELASGLARESLKQGLKRQGLDII